MTRKIGIIGEDRLGQARADRPGRVRLRIGERTFVSDMASAIAVTHRVVDGEDVLVLALAAPGDASVALYQPFDLEEAREFAAAILAGCNDIAAAGSQKGGAA